MNVFVIIILIFSFVVVFKIKVEAELFCKWSSDFSWVSNFLSLITEGGRGGGGGGVGLG